MSYATQAALAKDPDFQARVTAALVNEAVLKPDSDVLAQAIIRSPGMPAQTFVPVVAAAPGFGDKPDQSAITDPELLSAVQANWQRVTDAGVWA
jgi:hypothetical protein